MVRMALVDKVGLIHLPKTLIDAHRLIKQLQQESARLDEFRDLEERLYSRQAITQHMLLLDAALDAYTAERFRRQREADPEMFGVGLGTDESPPSQCRFGGYRFQVSVIYTPVWRPEETWDDCLDPPLDAEPTMMDVCHCPGKDGPSVMRVVDKQLMRLGLCRYEVFNGTGDGGGENEGETQGIHKTMEVEVPGYVRRRCLGHLAWRVADAMIAEYGLHKLVKRMCEYLNDGSTWTRLQAIATTPEDEGGLGLFVESSREHKSMFGTHPGSIVQGRPETDKGFYTFLRAKNTSCTWCVRVTSLTGTWRRRQGQQWPSWETWKGAPSEVSAQR